VLDGDRKPLIGASINIEGTTLGATADLNGDFIINVSPGKYTVGISFIGYKKKMLKNVIVENGKVTDIGDIKMYDER